MRCHIPDCIGERELQPISHSVIYRQRTLIVHGVPTDVCPSCGDAVVAEETLLVLEGLLRRQGGRKSSVLRYD